MAALPGRNVGEVAHPQGVLLLGVDLSPRSNRHDCAAALRVVFTMVAG